MIAIPLALFAPIRLSPPRTVEVDVLPLDVLGAQFRLKQLVPA